MIYIFTPRLHGNRCPFEDAKAGGMFFNIRIGNGKRDMIRAVLEGICYHLRWLLECEMRKVKTSDTIRFVGGGSLSPVTCQILADITGRTIETVGNAQEVGAIGAALVVAAGIKGEDVLELSRRLVKAKHIYVPNPENKEIYRSACRRRLVTVVAFFIFRALAGADVFVDFCERLHRKTLAEMYHHRCVEKWLITELFQPEYRVHEHLSGRIIKAISRGHHSALL